MFSLSYVGDLGYTGTLIDGKAGYLPEGGLELEAIQKLTAALGKPKSVIDHEVVAAVNKLLGTAYDATHIVNNIDEVTAQVAAQKAEEGDGLGLWGWLLLGGGTVGVLGTAYWLVRRSRRRALMP